MGTGLHISTHNNVHGLRSLPTRSSAASAPWPTAVLTPFLSPKYLSIERALLNAATTRLQGTSSASRYYATPQTGSRESAEFVASVGFATLYRGRGPRVHPALSTFRGPFFTGCKRTIRSPCRICWSFPLVRDVLHPVVPRGRCADDGRAIRVRCSGNNFSSTYPFLYRRAKSLMSFP